MSRGVTVVCLSFLLAVPALAGTRITHEINGKPTPLAWAPTAFPLRYQVDERVALLAPGAAGMVERAFSSWTRVSGADVRFESQGVVRNAEAQTAGRIVVSVADDLLAGQGALAMTSYSYDVTSGRMLDADIRVDPSIFDGQSNAEMALEHEVGHLLGLDHSAVLSSIMYPYVGPQGTPANFDSDDVIAICGAYPAGDPLAHGATLQGKVIGDEGGIFGAQVVALNSAGHPAGTVLTDSAGEFVLTGVPPGQYRLYAEPLDGPVGVDALQGTWRLARSAPFPTEFFGPPINVESGRIYGNLILNTAGPVQLNPRVVGVAPAATHEMSMTSTPISLSPGQTVRISVGGDGFVSGMTEFEILSPGFRRVSDYDWWDGSVSALFEVAASAPAASATILVHSGRETAALTGGLVVQKAPRVRGVRK